MAAIDSPDLITARELAGHLKVTTGTVLDWYRHGRIPARKLSHKVLRFSLRETLGALEASEKARSQGGAS